MLGSEGKDGQTFLCRAKTEARDAATGKVLRAKGSMAAMKVFKKHKSVGLINAECDIQRELANIGVAPPIVSTWVRVCCVGRCWSLACRRHGCECE
jgi:hypothetical protein